LSIVTRHAAIAFVALTTAAPVAAQAQTPPPAATHKHYEVSEHALQPGPAGELAPRLQNLGTHTFPVSTKHAGCSAS